MAGAVDGLINWLRRDQWREPFEALMDDHIGEACESIGGSDEDLASVIGADAFMVVWGCVFEDFVTLEVEDGGNIVADYLKRRGFRETASSRAYLNGLRNSVMSLYEVSDIRPGESFLARDLVLGGEPVRVSERSGSRQLRSWDRIAARLVPVGQKINMGGGLLRFERRAFDGLLKRLGEVFATEPPDRGGLAAMASLFTRVWLSDRLEAILNPPKLRNSDGDDILFTTVRYPLLAGARVPAVRRALDRSPELLRETVSFWNWIGEAPPIPQTKAPGDAGLTIGSWGPDGEPILGSVELEGRSLVLVANSAERAARGQALLAPLLADLVGAPQITSQTIDDLKASQLDDDDDELAAVGSDPPDEEQQAALGQWLEQYYRRLLGEPIPMLGNATPRELAKDAARVDELAAWLKGLENGAAKTAVDVSISYDLSWMWEELGIAALRR